MMNDDDSQWTARVADTQDRGRKVRLIGPLAMTKEAFIAEMVKLGYTYTDNLVLL